jgi:hypothetical protein
MWKHKAEEVYNKPTKVAKKLTVEFTSVIINHLWVCEWGNTKEQGEGREWRRRITKETNRSFWLTICSQKM